MICASGSAVEHLLAKERVAGSIPVSRFFLCLIVSIFCLLFYLFLVFLNSMSEIITFCVKIPKVLVDKDMPID